MTIYKKLTLPAFDLPTEIQPMNTPVTTSIIKSTLLLLLIAAMTVFFNRPVFALEPVFDIVDAEIVSSTPKTLEKVKKAIIAGATTRRWRISEIGPGHLEALINVRKHEARVDIVFTKTNYSITYKETVNLKYNNGKIHKNYNKWIRNLDLSIQKSLSY